MLSPALSVAHRRIAFERSFGPLKQTILNLAGDASKLKALRSELDEIIAPSFLCKSISSKLFDDTLCGDEVSEGE